MNMVFLFLTLEIYLPVGDDGDIIIFIVGIIKRTIYWCKKNN